MKSLFTFFAFAITCSLFAQDVTSYGGNIYATKKTNISIEKEIVSFTVRDEIAFVDILFEFNNPDTKDQKVAVQLSAPAQFSNPCQVKGFTIVQEEKIVPYQLKKRVCEECELIDPKNFVSNSDDYGDFVFLFDLTFKPGINTIQHSFNFPRSGDMDVYASYNHTLMNGENWAGGKIKDLTVNIDMGSNQYFYVTDPFGENADWAIIGTGKITDESFTYYADGPSKFVRTISGRLQIKVADFQPENVFGFGRTNRFLLTSTLGSYEEGELSKADLRILRNAVYAHYGYVFNSADLNKHFKQFAWYMPDPNLKMEDIVLTKDESEFLTQIKELEKK